MENFWNDLLDQISAYYESIIALMPKLILGIVIILVFWYLSSLFKRWSGKWLRLRMDDPLLAVFLSRLVKATFITIGLLAFLQVVGLGNAAGSLLAGAGISAFVIGFAFKDIGENFLAGILMAFKRPFRIGDIVESGDIKGTIIGLSLRDTQVKTFDGKDVYIPNGLILKNPIINYTIDGFLRQEFDIGIDYGSDIGQAMKIILGTLAKVPGILQNEKAPSVLINTLGSSSLNLKAYYWLDTFDKEASGLEIRNEAVERTLGALEAAGFYLPGDIVEVKNYSSQPLKMEPP
ncbi:MAG: mechanosensitive ion channel family protein [Lewinellaceae bacterium]|nr:mechanosensitive ion channel family protein [Phaeodactylibacter sp.]MCB9035340.1 mechanosensitive ion channel family protein [Lewinellaceae bacterium]